MSIKIALISSVLFLAHRNVANATSYLRGSITATRNVNTIDLQTSFSKPPCNQGRSMKESSACEQHSLPGDSSYLEDQYLTDDDDNYILKCTGYYDSSYWEHHHQQYEGINDNSCAYDVNGAEQCSYDFKNAAANGALGNAEAKCAVKGGNLYTFDGTISCVDGSSFTFVHDVLGCYTSCDPASAEFTIKSGWTADAFLTNLGLEKEGCKWLDITAYDKGDEDNVIDDDDDNYWYGKDNISMSR
mmetsp:Transcript_9388/g.10884  ORF Transcript_9388/g.10884 Transcript_9388/m.10884 type:complete len:244 (-) Transcript_9388:346-1077(-)